MEYQRQNNGLKTFLGHCGFLLTAAIVILVSQVLTLVELLNGTSWVWLYMASLFLMIVGGGLIGYAKFPVYRGGRFLSFGLSAVPEHLQRFYRWGWLVFLLGVGLSLCLLLSRP
jgi:hypothetical protein